MHPNQPTRPATRCRKPGPLHGRFARFVAALSMPLLAAILLLACLWAWLVPAKRRRLRTLLTRIPAACPRHLALWLFAGAVLERWPFLVAAILAVGPLLSLLLGGPTGIAQAMVTAVVAASLAPVFATDLKPWLFPGS